MIEIEKLKKEIENLKNNLSQQIFLFDLWKKSFLLPNKI